MTVHAPIIATQSKPEMREFLSLPTWIHAGSRETGGSLSLVEQIIPPGFSSPWHVHHDEDETFFVITGEVTVVFADRALVLGPGHSAVGPRAVPHGFRVTGNEPARLLLVTTGPGFADFVRDVGEPVSDGATIEPREPDLARVVALAERHGLATSDRCPKSALPDAASA